MRTYLFNFSYSPDAMRAMIARPHDRSEVVREAAESLGGKLIGFWFAFGEYDGHGIAELPDDTAAAAFAVTVTSTGALTKYETIPLIDVEEGIEIFKRAKSVAYAPPTKARRSSSRPRAAAASSGRSRSPGRAPARRPRAR
jgi:uncharacterized protein with GYD domain